MDILNNITDVWQHSTTEELMVHIGIIAMVVILLGRLYKLRSFYKEKLIKTKAELTRLERIRAEVVELKEGQHPGTSHAFRVSADAVIDDLDLKIKELKDA